MPEHELTAQWDPGGPPAAEPEAAGFWVRAGAFTLDLLFLCTVQFFLFYALHAAGADLPARARRVMPYTLMVLYYVGFASAYGRTLGKTAAGLSIRRLDGTVPDAWRLLLRFVGYVISGALGVGYLMAAFMPRKRALHDYLAGTTVVFSEPVGRVRRALLALVGVVGLLVFALLVAVKALLAPLPGERLGSEAADPGPMGASAGPAGSSAEGPAQLPR